jgi:anti-anti-sigma regulatory factor
MNPGTTPILSFPSESSSARRRALRKDLLNAIRLSESVVIVDLSNCRTLDYEDINSLLEYVAQAAGRDADLLFVAGSPVVRVLLDVTRISSLVPVFDSTAEALEYRRHSVVKGSTESGATESQQLRSA